MGIVSSLQSILLPNAPEHSYWSVKLASGKTLSELDVLVDRATGGMRPIDWSLDLVSTGDILKIRQITLHCPNGQRAWLKTQEPGTIFQLKVATVTIFGADRQVQAQIIGKVTNKVTGECDCWIWDAPMGQLIAGQTSVYRFDSWREGILPLGALSLDVLGVQMSAPLKMGTPLQIPQNVVGSEDTEWRN